MSEGIKKRSYHFEFVNPRQMKKYKFYFFDYLYYMGEIYHENKWGESNWRMSGFGVLIWYWGLILYPFLTILFEYIENSEAKRAIIYGWGMFPDRFLSFTIPQSEMRCPDETLRREEAYRYHKAPVYAFGFVCSGTMAVWKIGMDRQYMVIN